MKKIKITFSVMLIMVIGIVSSVYGANTEISTSTREIYPQTGTMIVKQNLRKEAFGKVTTVTLSVSKSVPHKYVSYHIQYTDGRTVGYLYNLELYSKDYETVYLREFMNEKTGRRDGFVSTSIIVYGNGEVRGNDYAYVIYSSISDK